MFHALCCCCRGDYGVDVGRNIIHGSDGVEVRQPHRPAIQPDCMLCMSAGDIHGPSPALL
jgi:hypothetical protein